MRTPMQELIDWLNFLIAVLPEGAAKNQLIIARNKAESMLEKEWDEIIDAHIDGQCGDTDGTPFEKAEQYYNETFNTKEK